MPIIVLREPDAVFVHIPKCGGLTVRNRLWADRSSGELPGVPANAQGLPCFSMVRNPFDRVVSAWKMFVEGSVGAGNWQRPADIADDLTLADFVGIVIDDTVHPSRRQTSAEKIRFHTLPASTPLFRIDLATYVGQFERYDESIGEIFKLLDAEPPPQIPRANTTDHQHYQTYFDDASVELLTDYYAADLVEFGYEF